MATGASALPPHSFATGSAVINMLRQIGLAVGVAVLIAILGSPGSSDAVLHVYQRATWVIAAISVAAAWIGLALLPGRLRPSEPVTAPAAAPAAAESAASK